MKFFSKIASSTGLAITAFLSCGKLFSSDVGIWQLGQISAPPISDITPKQHQLLDGLSGLSGTVYSTTGVGALTDQCLLSVASGNIENLRLTLANAPDGCRLKLTGTYELDGPLYVNRPLTALTPERKASDWFLPDTLVESQLGLYALCSAENGEMFCPGQQAGSPGAVIIIKQGSIHFTGEGGLHGVGIIDARNWPENSIPALQIPEGTAAASLSFNQVFLKGHYPLVSDIDDSHPYWNNHELADTGGSTARAAGRVFLWSRAGGGAAGRSNIRQFSSLSGAGGWRPPRKPGWTSLPRSHYLPRAQYSGYTITPGILERIYDHFYFNTAFYIPVVLLPTIGASIGVITGGILMLLTNIIDTTPQTVDPITQINDSLESIERRLDKLEQQVGVEAEK